MESDGLHSHNDVHVQELLRQICKNMQNHIIFVLLVCRVNFCQPLVDDLESIDPQWWWVFCVRLEFACSKVRFVIDQASNNACQLPYALLMVVVVSTVKAADSKHAITRWWFYAFKAKAFSLACSVVIEWLLLYLYACNLDLILFASLLSLHKHLSWCSIHTTFSLLCHCTAPLFLSTHRFIFQQTCLDKYSLNFSVPIHFWMRQALDEWVSESFDQNCWKLWHLVLNHWSVRLIQLHISILANLLDCLV
jgi:hypothetical protein